MKSPKSLAREVAIPPHILAPLLVHLDNYSAPGKNGLLFPAVESGGHTKHGALYRCTGEHAKLPDDPTSAGTTSDTPAATLAELMNRLGHTTATAALIYQHAAAGRDAGIVRRLSI